jgi:hypothetical protein
MTAGRQVIKNGKKFCGDNEYCGYVATMMKTSDQCTMDLGVIHGAFAGTNVMGLCCKTVCGTNNGERGMCSDHTTCKDVIDTKEGTANATLTSSSLEQTYKLRVPACSHEADGFMNLELNVDGGMIQDTTDSPTAATTAQAPTAAQTTGSPAPAPTTQAPTTVTAAEIPASLAMAAHPMLAAFLIMIGVTSS